MIYTGYYAKHGKLPNACSISVYVPKWFPNMMHVPCLAPTMKMVHDIHNGIITEEEYIAQFISLLDSRNLPWTNLVNELDGKILCCFEKPTDFCHRHIVAIYLEQYGGTVEEMVDNQPFLI